MRTWPSAATREDRSASRAPSAAPWATSRPMAWSPTRARSHREHPRPPRPDHPHGARRGRAAWACWPARTVWDPRQQGMITPGDYLTELDAGVDGLRIGVVEQGFAIPGLSHDGRGMVPARLGSFKCLLRGPGIADRWPVNHHDARADRVPPRRGMSRSASILCQHPGATAASLPVMMAAARANCP